MYPLVQVALAWLHAQGDDVFPIPGTKRVKYAEQNIKSFEIKLNEEDMKLLDFNVQGSRYNNMEMRL